LMSRRPKKSPPPTSPRSSHLLKSLLRRTAEGRLFMLETIREFALQQLAAMPECRDVWLRHVDHALRKAEQPQLSEIPAWLRQIEGSYTELRGGLAWLRENGEAALLLRLASRLARFWDARALLREGRLWLEAAVADAPAEASSERIEAFARLGHIAWRQGDIEAARPALDAAESDARALGEVRSIGMLHTIRGAIGITTGNLETACHEYEYALRLFREIDADGDAAVALHDLGLIAVEEGNYERARILFDESLQLARKVGSPGGESNALGSLALVLFERGEVSEAWDKTVEAMRLNRTHGQANLSVAGDLVMAAQIMSSRGDHREACRMVGAFDAYRELTGASADPISLRQRREVVAAAEHSIGAAPVQRALEAGSALSLTEAVDFVLSVD